MQLWGKSCLGARSSGLGKAFGIWRLKPQAWLFDWRPVTQLLWICFPIHKMGIIMALQYLQVIQEPQFFEALLHGTLLGTITLIASFILLKNFFCLFILFIWLCQVLVVALGSSLQHVRSFVVALGLLCSCNARAYLALGMWDLSSLTRDWTCVPCTGRRTLDCQGNPSLIL